jgi:hypothetical protein
MPIFEKPIDPAEIDADGLAYEVVAHLQKQCGDSVVTVGTKVKPPPGDDRGCANNLNRSSCRPGSLTFSW